MGNEAKKRFGERVRRARREARITQVELARRLGVSQGVISNVETGVSTIDAPDLPQWAEALGTQIMVFFLDEIKDLNERVTTLLNLFPEDQIPLILAMLECMAREMKAQANATPTP
jgi:transcriptional regulator with XRE-family HTH domain